MKLEFNSNDLTEDSFKLLMETATLSAGDVLDLSDLDLEADIDIEISSFKDQEVIDEYMKRFGPDEDAATRAFTLIAEGRTDDAMHVLSGSFPVAPPYHEMAIAAVIARGRAKEAIHAES